MKDSPSRTFELPTTGVNPLADAIREGIGASPDAQIVCVTPQFTRLRGMPMPGQPPETMQDWEDYRQLSMDDLESLGFGNWDGGLALIPGEWHSRLCAGLVLEGLSGRSVEVGKDHISNDIRFGCLAYGIRVGPATGGV